VDFVKISLILTTEGLKPVFVKRFTVTKIAIMFHIVAKILVREEIVHNAIGN